MVKINYSFENATGGGSMTASISSVTNNLIMDLIARDRLGQKKYGKTLDRDDLSINDWLEHMKQELLDAAGYAESAKRKAT